MPDLANDVREYFDALIPPTDPDAVRRRPVRGPTRWPVAAAAAVVLFALVGAAIAVRDVDDPDVVDTVFPPDGALVLASDGQGRLALFDVASGELVETLTEEQPNAQLAPSVTADGRYAYLTVTHGTCEAVVERLDLESGAVTVVAGLESRVAFEPATVSADGEVLTYMTAVCGPGDVAEVVVRDLRIFHEWRFPMGSPPIAKGRAAIDGLSENAQHLAYAYVGGGGVAYGIRVLDLHTATTADDGRPLDLGPCARQSAPAFRADGGLLAVTCALDDPDQTVVALFDPASGARVETLFALDVGEVFDLSAAPDGSVVASTDIATYRWDGTDLTRLPLPDGTTGAVVVRSATGTTPTTSQVPFGVDVGPALDPGDLAALPDEGLAVQYGDGLVLLVATDGRVLGHLNGYQLHPPVWSNPVLRGAGPLVLGHGDETVQLDGDALVPVTGAPGVVPLADGAALEPMSEAAGAVVGLASGRRVELPRGAVDVSADRDWVTVRETNADGTGDGRTTAYWLGNGDATAVSLDDGCIAADDTGRVPVLLCGLEIRIDDAVVHAGGPFPPPTGEDGVTFPPVGHWTAAQLSDDHDELLLQHSGECESQSGWRLSLTEPDAEPVAVGAGDDAWDSGVLGWLADGRAVAAFGPGVCGTAFPSGPGVYVGDADDDWAPVYAPGATTQRLGAKLWRQAPA